MTGSPDRRKHRQVLCALDVTGEQQVLAPNPNDLKGSLGGVVVLGARRIVKDMPDLVAVFEHVRHCGAQRDLWWLA